MNTTVNNYGRFTTRTGATIYEDNRHIVIKVKLEGGATGTLVKERQAAGTFRNQMMTIDGNGDVTVVEVSRN